MAFNELLGILNFAITLTFIILVLSLFASLAVEAVSAALATRGTLLRERVFEMFADPEGTGFARSLMNSPLIASLSDGRRPPSYIPASTFALAVVTELAERRLDTLAKLPPPLRAIALATGISSEDERKAFQAEVEAWYDRCMERLSGTFRRSARTRLFIAGFVLAAALNADMLRIASSLWEHRLALGPAVERIEEIQEEVAEKAREAGTTVDLFLMDPDNEEFRRSIAGVFSSDGPLTMVGLPIGWALEQFDCEKDTCTATEIVDAALEIENWSIVPLIGWVLTALAILPGTNFWFDVLGKLLKIRGAGLKPGVLQAGRSGGSTDVGNATSK
ncbi:MAG: hypothetical protein AAF526_03905 [Pseudomonadota bacterium]